MGGLPAAAGVRLSDDMLSLPLRCVAATAGGTAEVVKRLPRTTTVASLSQLCGRLFRLPAARLTLALLRPGAPPTALAEPQRDLHWLGAEAGDVILVDVS